MGLCRRSPFFVGGGSQDPSLLWWESERLIQTRPSLIPFSIQNVFIVDQTVQACLRKSARKIWPFASRLSSHLTSSVITDTDRSPTYDFVLTFHSNKGLSRTVLVETRKLFPLPGIPWNLALAMKKTGMMRMRRPRKVSRYISSRVDTKHECVGRTDGHLPTSSIALSHSVAIAKSNGWHHTRYASQYTHINAKNCSLSTTYNGEMTHRKQQK